MSNTESAATQLKAGHESGEGPCPVCHNPRAAHGCWTTWSTELGSDGKWSGWLGVSCHAFPRDRIELAERLNVYHQRVTP